MFVWRTLSLGIGLLASTTLLACSFDYIIWTKSKDSETPLFRIVTSDELGTGYIDGKGKIVIRPQYGRSGNYGNDFHEGVAEVWSAKNDLIYIDSKNRRLRQFDELFMNEFSEGLAAARREDLYGFVNHKGKFVIPEKFDSANPFREGLAAVEIDGRFGYINAKGEWQTSQRYAHAGDFHEGLAWVIEKGDCAAEGKACLGLYTVGDSRIPPAYAPRCRYSLINSRGEIVSAQAYLDTEPFSEGFAPVSDGRLWGYADRSGKLVIPFRYFYAHAFSEGKAAVCTTIQTCGYIDTTGTMIIAPKFRTAFPFSERLAAVQLDTGWYSYIDSSGNIAIRGRFDAASNFVKGLGHVSWRDDAGGEHWSYIDRSGKAIFTYTRRDEGPR